MKKANGPTLVVLAAGMGSRFGGLKQLEPLSKNGNILIEYSVFDAIRAGFTKVVFIVQEAFVNEFAALVECMARVITIEYAFQNQHQPPGIKLPGRKKPWGTGYALLAAEHLVAEPMAVINADDFYGTSAYATAAAFLSQRTADSTHYGMLGYSLPSVLSAHGSVSRGLCQLASDGKLLSIAEHNKVYEVDSRIISEDDRGRKTDLSVAQLASMNFWLLTPSIFKFLNAESIEFIAQYGTDLTAEFLLPDIIGRLLQNGDITVECLPHSDTWFGMTHPEDRINAVSIITKMHKYGIYPTPLWREDITNR